MVGHKGCPPDASDSGGQWGGRHGGGRHLP